MKKLYALAISLIVLSSLAQSQTNRYIIQLRDKNGTPHSLANPATYLSAKAISKRTAYNIALDSTDLPISPTYLNAIRSIPNVTVLNVSKWFNQVLVRTTDPAALATINAFAFVKQSNYVAPLSKKASTIKKNIEEAQPIEQARATTFGTKKTQQAQDNFSYGAATNQVSIHNGQYLHKRGYTGRNMTFAMLDAGYFNYKTSRAYDSVRLQGRFLGEWDFVMNEASVNEDNAHGTYCLSIIAANLPGELVGTAPHSKFWLFRTEDAATEFPVEEQNWVAAAEFADSAGVEMISSSLGYSEFDDPSFNHSYASKDGNTALITRAADLAAKKGILVMNSAGNSGNNTSDAKYIACPADADSILTVGAVDVSGNIGAFSSWGYNSAGKVKPDVVSVGVGTSYVTAGGNIFGGNGTSFACPNLAGLVACLWEAFPEANNMTVIDAVKKSSNKYLVPNNRYGYGAPDFRTAFHLLIGATFSAKLNTGQCVNKIEWSGKGDTSMHYILERKVPGSSAFQTLATINPVSNSFQKDSYSYTDELKSAYTGTITYRLRLDIHNDTSLVLFEKSYENSGPCFSTAQLLPVSCGVAQLKWEVKDDTSVTYTIQRKTRNEVSYINIATVKGASNELQTNRYQLNDTLKKLTIGLVEYRIIYGQKDTSFVMFNGNYSLATACAAQNKLSVDDCVNTITWVAKDDSSATYVVQRRYEGQNNYLTFAYLKGKSTTLNENNYSVTDSLKRPFAGAISYRIMLTVRDTTIKFSDTGYIHTKSCFEKTGAFFTPNPMKDRVIAVLNTKESGTVSIIIYDMNGRKVYQYQGSKSEAYTSIPIVSANLSRGVFFGVIRIGNKKVAAQKIVK